jgi:cytochrome c oxidase subunit 2
MRTISVRLSTAVVLGASALIGACGTAKDPGAGMDLSGAGRRGATIARDRGCAGCHGSKGEGGVGPKWVGLAGSEVELADGSRVTADDAYLRRAITEPDADKLAGYSLAMPKVELSTEEVDDLVAYIKDLKG